MELGQYNVSAIFNNDGSNLAAARKLASGNYNADFKMPNMPEQNVKYNNQDTRRLAENGKAYAADLNALYKEAYAKITIQYVMNYYRQHCLMLYMINSI